MGPKLAEAIIGLSKRMLAMKIQQEDCQADEMLNEREFVILSLLKENGTMNVSDIAEADPSVSYSTISTDITRLWRDKKMVTKTIDPDNQRVTLVELTDKGRKSVEFRQKQKDERFKKLYEALDPSKEEAKTLIDVCNRASEYLDNILSKNGFTKPKK
ncbi:MAG: MarR family transcriptional regulator [Sedimentisphaerales bacterium]|nr:MarR family transcriptional regulator [Sedimentisphaerales bacterium]